MSIAKSTGTVAVKDRDSGLTAVVEAVDGKNRLLVETTDNRNALGLNGSEFHELVCLFVEMNRQLRIITQHLANISDLENVGDEPNSDNL